MIWDIFISHATEDKAAVADPLAQALKAAGLFVWYDRFELQLGDRLRTSIDYGLTNSRFGIVILSPSFFKKRWPQLELDGLAQREVNGQKVILPIWYNIAAEQVRENSPMLADRVAVIWSDDMQSVLSEIIAVIHSYPLFPNSNNNLVSIALRGSKWSAKALRVGLWCKLVVEKSGQVGFSKRFIDYICKESKNTITKLETHRPDEIWTDTLILAALKTKGRSIPVYEEELDHFLTEIGTHLLHYILQVAQGSHLIWVDDDEILLVDQELLDEFFVMADLIKSREEIISFVVRALVELVRARLLLFAPLYISHSHFLALFLFQYMKAFGYIRIIEKAFSTRNRTHPALSGSSTKAQGKTKESKTRKRKATAKTTNK